MLMVSDILATGQNKNNQLALESFFILQQMEDMPVQVSHLGLLVDAIFVQGP